MKHKISAVLITLVCLFSVCIFPAYADGTTSLEDGTGNYTVKKGDTLFKVGLKYNYSLNAMIAANPQLKNPNLIYPGDTINIPNLSVTTPETEISQTPSVTQTPSAQASPKLKQTPGSSANDSATPIGSYEQQVIDLVNDIRVKNGLNALTANAKLSDVAREKSKDMHDKNYFSHTSPTYGSPFDMMKTFGISYNTAGENIAKGQRTPQEVVDAWMNSQGHRENILKASFTQIGVGYYADGNYWTQMFIG